MHGPLKSVTFAIVFCLVFGTVALLQAGGRDYRDDRIDKLQNQVWELSRRLDAVERVCLEKPRLAYAGVGKASPLHSIQKQGALLYLVNGSAWSVAQRDQAMVLRWRLTDEIQIEPGRTREHPYLLFNRRTDQIAEAQYLDTNRLK